LRLRLRGGAIAVIGQWLFTFVVVEITPPMIQNITYRSYIVFAVFNFVSIIFVCFTFPETAGRPLESVDFLFSDRDGKRPSIWRVVKDSTSAEFNAEYEMHRAEQTMAAPAVGKPDLEEKPTKEQSKHVELAD
jgi:hypothetical protein